MAFRPSELFRMVGQSDALLDEAWTHRKWSTFVLLWLAVSIGMAFLPAVMVLVVLLVPGGLYNGFATLIRLRTIGISIGELWHLAAGLGIIIGLFTLVFTVPVMLFRQVCGDLDQRSAHPIADERH
jgi:hypothetical protein